MKLERRRPSTRARSTTPASVTPPMPRRSATALRQCSECLELAAAGRAPARPDCGSGQLVPAARLQPQQREQQYIAKEQPGRCDETGQMGDTTGMAEYSFTIVFERDEDDGYVVSCPALQGCHSEGDTIDEAR